MTQGATVKALLPDSTDSLERSLIGAVLTRPEFLVDLPWLETMHFAGLKQRAVWQAIRNLEATGKAVDVLMVADELAKLGKLDAVGGEAELGLWALHFPILENCVEYANQIREHAIHRATLVAVGEVHALANQHESFGTQLLDDAHAKLTAIQVNDVTDASQPMSALVKEHAKYLEQVAQQRATGAVELTGITTGVAGLDAEIGGWQPGIVSIVCGRPGHGKSSLMLATADIASSRGDGVHVFSLEDPRKAYMNRALARCCDIPLDRLARAQLTREDMSRFATGVRELKARRWIVDDVSSVTAGDIVRSVRRRRRENGTKIVLVDYLQLLKLRRDKGVTKHEAIGDALNELADAAKKDNMAYVVGSQLNRGVESRDDKRPVDSDLRESGTIEERSKCIVGLYRGAKYYQHPDADIDTNADGTVMSQSDFEASVQLLILKNSQGPAPGRVVAGWEGQTTRIW